MNAGDLLAGLEIFVARDLQRQLIYNNTPPSGQYLQEVAAPTVRLRVGKQIGDLMIYGLVGAGVSVLHARDEIFPTRPGDPSRESDATLVSPTASFGFGAEFTVDPMFVRFELEARRVFTGTPTSGRFPTDDPFSIL